MRTRRTQSSSNLVPAEHQSVLLHEAILALSIEPSDTIVDATLGGGGHAALIAERLGKGGTLLGLDADQAAVERAERRLKEIAPKARLHVVKSNFRHLAGVLEDLEISSIDGALFDLGWSAYHLHAGRGFSFKKEEPLLMTYNESPDESDLTARTIVNEWDEAHIADILWGWGEERFSRQIAGAIVRARIQKPLETTSDLIRVIESAVPARYKRNRLHPATRTFQALRMTVNDEIGALTEGLHGAQQALNSGGRLVVITFHSIEDRTVKQLFRTWEREKIGKTHKKVKPTEEEVEQNPRARSALLRTFEMF